MPGAQRIFNRLSQLLDVNFTSLADQNVPVYDIATSKWLNLPGSTFAPLSVAKTGKCVWVDAVNGNDATGARQRADLPFLTLNAAKTAASSGDTIIVRPGTYDEKNLMKDGVDWFFYPNAIVQYTGSGDGAIWDDSSTGLNGSAEFKICGHGRFIYSGSSTTAATQAVFNVTNASTHVDCVAEESFNYMQGTSTGKVASIIQTDGYIKFLGHAIETIVPSATNAAAIRWEGGDMDINVQRIVVNRSYAIWSKGAGANYTIWVIAARITTQDSSFETISSDATSDATARVLVDVQTITSANRLVVVAAGEVRLKAHRITGTGNPSALIGNSGGKLFVNAFSIDDAGSTSTNSTVSTSGGTTYLSVDQLTRTGAGRCISSTSTGTITVYKSTITNSVASGTSRIVFHSGTATTNLIGCVLTMTSNALAPIQVAASGVSLDGCIINAEASTDSITASTAQNVAVNGASWSNRAVNGNITLTPLGSFTVASATQMGTVTANTFIGALTGTASGNLVSGGAAGTPSSITLTNGTGLPLTTGVTGTLPVANGGTGITSFGTGVATALGVNTGSAGAFVVLNGAGGTPSSLTLTSATGLPLTTGVTGILPSTNGGTGVNNGFTATLGGALVTEQGFSVRGTYATTVRATGVTDVTLPTSGTLLSVVPNYLTGCTLANSAGDASNDIDIAAGTVADSTNANWMTLTALTKQIDATWAVGTNAGGMDSANTETSSRWYHLFVIKRTDTNVVDVMFSQAPGTNATVTMTVATPCVVTWTTHGLEDGAPIKFTTTGALPTGLTAGTTYYVKSPNVTGTFNVAATQGGAAINTTGTQSGVHTGTSNPTMPTNYTLWRRIGSVYNGSGSVIKPFKQYGDRFRWVTLNKDFDADITTARSLAVLLTPPGVQTMACIRLSQISTDTGGVLLTQLDETDSAASATYNDSIGSDEVGGTANRVTAEFWTDTFSQIGARASAAATSIAIYTRGWMDTRGQ